MKRAIYLLLAIVLPMTLRAETLVDMTSAIEALGSYEVSFRVESEGYAIDGCYAVEGDNYYFKMDSQEVYGSAKERCTVSHTDREVVLELVGGDVAAPMIVTNPIQAFTMLGDGCDIIKMERVGETMLIYLKPKLDDDMISSSILEVDSNTNLPLSVTYLADSESIKIVMGQFMPRKKNLSPQYPEGYEVIDIR